MNNMSRRGFVTAVAGATCACLLCPHLTDAAAPTSEPAAGKEIDAGPLASLGSKPIDTRFATLGGFFLVVSNDRLVAVSDICTHKRSRVTVKNDQLGCSAHGSAFTSDGLVIQGPARQPLPHLGIRVDTAGNVFVNPSKKFTEKQWDDAEAFVTIKKA